MATTKRRLWTPRVKRGHAIKQGSGKEFDKPR